LKPAGDIEEKELKKPVQEDWLSCTAREWILILMKREYLAG